MGQECPLEVECFVSDAIASVVEAIRHQNKFSDPLDK